MDMNITLQVCPICDEGTLRGGSHTLEFSHRGDMIFVDGLQHSVCSECGADPILPDQVRHNHAIIADARRAHDGLLTGVQIKAIRARLCLSQAQASEIFGGGANAFSKYERGEVIQSIPMDRLLRIAEAFPITLAFLKGPQESKEIEDSQLENDSWTYGSRVATSEVVERMKEVPDALEMIQGGTVVDFQDYRRRVA